MILPNSKTFKQALGEEKISKLLIEAIDWAKAYPEEVKGKTLTFNTDLEDLLYKLPLPIAQKVVNRIWEYYYENIMGEDPEGPGGDSHLYLMRDLLGLTKSYFR
jgi:hypothetical protein